MSLRRPAALALAALVLTACATTSRSPVPPPPARVGAPTAPAPSPYLAPTPLTARPAPRSLADLPGWDAEDHAAALAAAEEECAGLARRAPSPACSILAGAGPLDEAAARQLLERRFRPEAVGGPGLMTGYFAPIYQARVTREGDYTVPVRPRPADLPHGGAGVYADRAAIEARPTGDALAWMKPEELFFLQIQGSGVLTFPDGRRLRAVFDGSNGAKFRGVAGAMAAQSLIPADDVSANQVRLWLAAHRGPAADAIMRLNPRYVFFRLSPDDGLEPAGAAGARLVPGRAIAVDPAANPLGGLYWIDAGPGQLPGARPFYRRLVAAMDVGGAITGPARADLYLGQGDAPGDEAGRVRHPLLLYRLVPIAP